MPLSTIPTKFLIISDTHNFSFTSDQNTAKPLPLHLPTPAADVLLHCGDLTETGKRAYYGQAIEMLGQIPAELKLVIAGNHEVDLDRSFCEAGPDWWRQPGHPQISLREHDRAVEAMTGAAAKQAGVIYLTEGTHSFTLSSGANFTIYVSPYTPEFQDWGFGYKHHEDRFNTHQQIAPGTASIATDPIPAGVDIVMTHGPPKGIRDWCSGGNVGCKNLLRAIRRVKPIMHCFGHIHEGHGAEIIKWKKMKSTSRPQSWKNEAVHRAFEDEDETTKNPYPEPFVWKVAKGEKTLAVNACIMTGGYEPLNPPWLVELELPRAQ